MKSIWMRLDKLVCTYLGLDKSEIIPHFVGRKGKEIVVLNTESFKRHVQEISISRIDLNMMNKENKEKLGVAVGKTIAANLIVSFEELVIKRENIHAR